MKGRSIGIVLILSIWALSLANAEEIILYSVPKKFYETNNNIFSISADETIPEKDSLYLYFDDNKLIEDVETTGSLAFIKNQSKMTSFRYLEIKTSGGSTLVRDISGKKQEAIELNLLDSLRKMNLQRKLRGERIEICLLNKDGGDSLKICLPKVYARIDGARVYLKNIKSKIDNFFTVNSKIPVSKTVNFSSNEMINIYVQNEHGYTLDFRGRFNSRDFVDIVKDESSDTLVILSKAPLNIEGEERVPSIYSKDENSIYKAIGFADSIGHFKPLYKYANVNRTTKVAIQNSTGMFAGLDLGQFNFLTPNEKLKIKTEDFQISSYQKEKYVELVTAKNMDFEQKPPTIKENKGKKEWLVKAEKINIYNENLLTYNMNKQDHVASHLAYRTNPSQFSVRISNTFTASQEQLLSTEFNFQHWFEDIFSIDSYYFTNQRWGIDAQVFNSLKKFTISDRESKYDNMSANLKYRFTPGVWNYDESFGFLIGYQNFSIVEKRFPMLGIGAFWSRSMPKAIDDVLNFVPIFRKKKWVNVDFTYYNVPLDKDKTIKSSNYKLSFYGKMLWTNSFFTELGFGMRTHDLQIKSESTEVQFHTYYGIFGLGIDF